MTKTKAALITRQDDLLMKLEKCTDQQEYDKLSKELVRVTEAIKVHDDHELEIQTLELEKEKLEEQRQTRIADSAKASEEQRVKDKDSKRQLFGRLIPAVLSAVVSVVGLFAIAFSEKTDLISNKMFSWMHKPKL